MARGKKKEELTLEEKLERALVPVEEQPYEVPENWCWTIVGNLVDLHRGVSYKKNESHLVPRFVLVVEVTGNETVPTPVILSQLRRAGVRPGAYGPAIREMEAANDALRGLPELSYLAVNIYGTRAQVVVHEAEEKPR